MQNLGEHAALAIAAAQLIEEPKRELAERKRMAARLELLADASRVFSEATGEHDHSDPEIVALARGPLVAHPIPWGRGYRAASPAPASCCCYGVSGPPQALSQMLLEHL
jgi:hypothetical protein